MFSTTAKSAVLGMALTISGIQAQAYHMPVEVFEYMDDERVVAFIDQKDMETCQTWTTENLPPLAIEGALTAVRKHIAARQPEIGDATLENIELRQIPRHPGHWHYMVKLKDHGAKSPYHYFVVLMNGKVIPAVHEIAALK